MLRVLSLFWFILPSMLFAAEFPLANRIVMDERLTRILVGSQMSVWLDKGQSLSPEQATSPSFQDQFQLTTQPEPNYGYSRGAAWARFQVDYQGTKPLEVVLYFASPLVDQLEVFTRQENGELVRRVAGDTYPIQTRSYRHRYPNFSYILEPGLTTFFVRLSGVSPLVLRPVFASRDAFYSMVSEERSLNFLYFGIMFAMLAYNLFLFVSVRDLIYLYYIFCVGFVVLAQWTINGFHYQTYLNSGGDAANVWVGASIGLAMAASTLFALRYLDIQQQLPAWKRWGDGIIFGSLAYSFGSLYGDYQTIASWGVPLSIACALYCLTIGFLCLFQGVRAARFYTLAWSFFCLATIVEALRLSGVIPTNTLTQDVLQLGSTLEVLLLSFGLADRIKLLQNEVYSSQKKALSEQRRTNAELKRLAKMKDDFLANTSHELRTPLHAIVGLADVILTQGQQDPESKYRLHMILVSAKRLTLLVNDILDFAKLKHRRIQLNEKAVDLAVLGQYVVEMMRPLTQQKALELRIEIDDSLGLVVGDEDRLQQILFNLVGNAIKFTEKGYVLLKITREDERIFVRVQDTGIGIPPEKQESIFEAFAQADGSIERVFGGTGLGLSITRKLVELHGGKVTVASEEGKGSTFTVSLPLRKASQGPGEGEALGQNQSLVQDLKEHILLRPDGPLPLKANMNFPKATRCRILVADDDPYNLEVLVAQLRPEGYEVETASDGQAALHMVLHEPPFDLALFDVMMPKLNGFELTRKVREIKDHSELPILLLTAKSQTEDVLKGFEMGANDYLTKPFARYELLARLETHATIRRQTLGLKHLSEDLSHEMEAKQVMVQDLAHRTNNPLHAATLALDLVDKDMTRLKAVVKGLIGEESLLDEDGKICAKSIDESFASLRSHEQYMRGSLDRVVVAIKEIRILSGIDGRPLEEVQFQDALSSAILRLEYSMGADAIRRLEFDWLSDCRYLLVTHPIVLALCLEKILRQILSSTMEDLLIPVSWLEEEGPGLRMEFKSTGARVLTLSEECPTLWQHIAYTLKPYGIRLDWNGQEPYLELRNQRIKPLTLTQEAS